MNVKHHVFFLLVTGMLGCENTTDKTAHQSPTTPSSTGTPLLPPCSSQSQPSATARASVQALIQQQAGKAATYTADLGWKETSLRHTSDAGSLQVQQMLANWAINMQRSNQVEDTIISISQELTARRLYGPNWKQVVTSAAIGADEARHRADKQAWRISHFLDSLDARKRIGLPVAAGASNCCYWLHTFQLTSPDGKVTRDSLEFIVLPSQQVQRWYSLTGRYWEPKTEDRF